MQLLSHLPTVVSPGRGRIARTRRNCGGWRPRRTLLSLLVDGATPRGPEDVT
jgi:hypothetical protein